MGTRERIKFANIVRGEALAARFGAQALRLADLPARLHEFDAVVSCTASTLPIIGLVCSWHARSRCTRKRSHSDH